MGVFDQAARYASQSDPHAVVGRLLRDVNVSLRFSAWEDSRPTPRPGDEDRTADRVAVLVDDGNPDRPWLLVLEFQSQHDPDKLDVTLVEAAQLREGSRHGEGRREKYLVIVGFTYLHGICPDDVLDMTLPNGFGILYAPLVWNVEGEDARAALGDFATGRTTWGILFFVPLMKGGDEPEVIERWKELTRMVPEDRRRDDLGGVALIFAELAGRFLVWEKNLKEWKMTESMVVNQWIQEAEEKTYLNASKKHLRMVLNTRFPGETSKELHETIEQQSSASLLDEWLEQSLRVTSFDEFMKMVRR